jgi:hypothetical protein
MTMSNVDDDDHADDGVRVCVCVCVRARALVRSCVRVYVCVRTPARACVRACASERVSVCAHARARALVRMLRYIDTSMIDPFPASPPETSDHGCPGSIPSRGRRRTRFDRVYRL